MFAMAAGAAILYACTSAPTAAPTPTATPTPAVTISTAPPTTPAPTPQPIAKLRLGETATIAVPSEGTVRLTVQSAEESTRRSFLGTPPPGTTQVTVIIRVDNGLTGPITASEAPWEMGSADGVRHYSTSAGRTDTLHSSPVIAGSFLVGSITFEVPAGPLDLYYTQSGAPFNIFVWQVR